MHPNSSAAAATKQQNQNKHLKADGGSSSGSGGGGGAHTSVLGAGTQVGTLAYAFTRADRSEATVLFWDLSTDEKSSIQVS